MPTYVYRCPDGHEVEAFHSMSEDGPDACELCEKSPIERVLFPVAVHFKGSGFYATDYGRGNRKPEDGKEGDESGSSSPDEKGSADKKSEGSSESSSNGSSESSSDSSSSGSSDSSSSGSSDSSSSGSSEGGKNGKNGKKGKKTAES